MSKSTALSTHSSVNHSHTPSPSPPPPPTTVSPHLAGANRGGPAAFLAPHPQARRHRIVTHPSPTNGSPRANHGGRLDCHETETTPATGETFCLCRPPLDGLPSSAPRVACHAASYCNPPALGETANGATNELPRHSRSAERPATPPIQELPASPAAGPERAFFFALGYFFQPMERFVLR
ncbi:hypothetical protein MAPG_09976 [Magnaporthiopsis poae ATCC 64411]|uniref:Uncharacterized protein n=1 Tax=Magnaporthiopsis poae (strain ATCC 64411 / 73-15) TaxID=644358 RepID=A0A0C4EBC8_MAGP6|nr:hypothetical protein MAPG_09976 [Magnaporthiopsis poae ATCC 64411]